MKYPYGVLGVAENAPQEEIRRKYLELVKRHSPEREPLKFQEISDAYRLVENELARARLSVFGISQPHIEATEMSDLLPVEDSSKVHRPGMAFWLKLLASEHKHD